MEFLKLFGRYGEYSYRPSPSCRTQVAQYVERIHFVWLDLVYTGNIKALHLNFVAICGVSLIAIYTSDSVVTKTHKIQFNTSLILEGKRKNATTNLQSHFLGFCSCSAFLNSLINDTASSEPPISGLQMKKNDD